MSFTPTAEQRKILEMVRKLVHQRILPRAARIDEEGVYPEYIFYLLIEQGLSGMAIPKPLDSYIRFIPSGLSAE